ncbi:Transcriptional adapter ada2 [Kappamyces sp. JEL0829]|nr:Transcriptional adapter ada2 [Kappamyces sp. JEL0829]
MGVQVKKRKHNAKADSNDIQEDFGQKYHCDACSKDITHLVIIRCAICSDFDLCVPCFSSGVELNDHKRTHDYRVIDALDFPIFESDWGADEEILLVEGLELFGLGNWETIADHIGTKNALEVGEHYNRVFVQSESWPYPDMTDRFEMSPNKRLKARPPGYTVSKLPKHPRPPASTPVNHEIGGFMPGRKEFEYEYENDADQIVKDIEFGSDDSKEDTALKCAVLNIYNTILDRRASRKNFIQSLEKKRSKDEKELYQKYRVFAKMQSPEDFELLMDGLVAEAKLRAEIAKYQEYLRMGINTAKEGNDYEKQKTARANKIINVAQLEKTLPTKRSILSGETGVSPVATPGRLGTPGTVSSSSVLVSLPNSVPTTRKTANPLDISHADGIDLLIDEEKVLCSQLRLYPRAYMGIKDIILREYAAKGVVKKRSVRSMIKIDVNKTSKIFDFFSQMGWIQC